MRNIVNILFCFLLFYSIGNAQSIKRSVICSFGSSNSNATTHLSTTFGQPSNIGTVTDSNNFIRQGFQQPLNNQITTYGCTDSLAYNYDSLATIDDGSCLYNVNGCTDSLASNYNPFATVDDSTCLYSPFVFGCTDSTALNYDPLATVDDSSCCDSTGQLWRQIGQTLYGDSINDFFGCQNDAHSFNNDGSIIAIGAMFSGPTNNGQVKVYQNINNIWTQLGQNLNGDNSNDWFGTGISLNSAGNILAIGAKGANINGNNSGQVRIFQKINNIWIQLGQDLNGSNIDEQFGTSVSLNNNGNILAVGGVNKCVTYEWDGISWNQLANNMNSTPTSLFGNKVRLNNIGDILAITALSEDDTSGNWKSGAVYIFELDSFSNTWNQLGQTLYGDTALDYFGTDMDISSDGLTISACTPTHNTTINPSYSKVFNFNGISWVQKGQTIYSVHPDDEFLGVALSGNGDIVNLGANGPFGNYTGYVLSFQFSGNNWNQIGNQLIGHSPFTAFGWWINMCKSNNILAISNQGNSITGEVEIYNLNIPCNNVYGCLDPLALNFDPYATVDDNSCVYPSYGCLDSLALNYNSLSNIDDGSCNYCVNDTSYTNIITCDEYVFNGDTLTVSGTYYDTLINVGGCDSLVTLNLTINYSNSSTSFITACDSYLWEGDSLTQGGIYVKTLTNTVGCDSIATLWLTIPNSTSGNSSITACDYYVWRGDTLFVSDTYSDTLTNIGGCDSIATLYLTILNGSTNTVTLTSCDSLVWNSVTYTLTGIYTNTYTDVNGCDSTVALDLTINNSPTSSFTITSCDSYSWDGNLYDSTGIYTTYYTNINGCDSIVTLDLTINYSSLNSISLSSCDSYNLSGQTLDSSGIYVYTFTNLYGCDSIVYLDLTILNSTTSSFNIVSCDSYIWDGVVYDSTSTYVNVYTGFNGCDSIVTLDLIINYSNATNINDTACDYYIWNGITYNTSGVYSSNYINVNGCDSIVTLNLYISSCSIYGCTDSLALNYDSLATIDDSTCLYYNCQEPAPTSVYSSDIADIRATVNWDNMNSVDCKVLKYIIRYRELGTNSWTVRSGGIGNGLCNFGVNNTSQILYNLNPSTTYQYRIKAYYCYGGASVWTLPKYFTTDDVCPPMTNLATQIYPIINPNKVTFSWDSTGLYVFARVALRIDTSGANWQTAGGYGVYFPTMMVNKFGLVAGETYRAQGRTFCDSNITSYRSWWTPPIFWTQPIFKQLGGNIISNLEIYPNPSRDVFNISFNSEKQQDLTIRILNVVGAEVYIENKENFIGEYTKQVNLDKYGKGIYFLEIETNTGVVNKKLILQ